MSGSVRAAEFERATEMRLAGDEFVALRKQQPELIVQARIVRQPRQPAPRKSLGLVGTSRARQQIHGFAVGPAAVRVGAQRRGEQVGRSLQLSGRHGAAHLLECRGRGTGHDAPGARTGGASLRAVY